MDFLLVALHHIPTWFSLSLLPEFLNVTLSGFGKTILLVNKKFVFFGQPTGEVSIKKA